MFLTVLCDCDTIYSVVKKGITYMPVILESNNHSVFALNYNLIMVVKYRRRVIDDSA